MRHRKTVNHLSRTASHKKALMRNLAAQVIQHKEIRTTVAKAKELRSYVERLITYGKKGSVHHRRLAFKFLQNKEAVTNLFDEIAPTFEGRQGGYTRIIKLGFRKGDAAPMSIFQLVGFEKIADKKKVKAAKKEKKEVEKEAEKAEVAEATTDVAAAAPDESEPEETIDTSKDEKSKE